MTDDNRDSEPDHPGDSEDNFRTDGGEAVAVNSGSSPPTEDAQPQPSEPNCPSVQSAPTDCSEPDSSEGVHPARIDPTAGDPATEELLRDFLEENQDHLEPTSPDEAVQLYLKDKAREFAHSTINAHRSRLSFFVDWCGNQGISNLNDLSARDLHDFRVWRREEADLAPTSERTQMVTVRVFIKWCETIDAVESRLHEKVEIPKIKGSSSRDDAIFDDRTQRILDHLHTFEYSTTAHVTWTILTNTGIRLGSVRALDVKDYHPDGDPPYLDIQHRPNSDTPLKKKERGERPVGIDEKVCQIIDDYLEHQRPEVTDDYDREPLLATAQGRVARSTIRKYAYKWSRPCVIGRKCPHDRDPLNCEASVNLDQVAQCPSSVTPHPIRRGYITQLLQNDAPVEVVSKRCDVSPDNIEEHYDVRTEEAKMRQRQKILEEVQVDDSDSSG